MIEIENLTLKIGEQELLIDESLCLYEGYVHLVVGDSGSGKSTLLYELSLLSKNLNTKYRWNETRIDQLNNKMRDCIRRNHIGYVLQDLELISCDLTIKENLECMFALSGQSYSHDKVSEYMQTLNLNISLTSYAKVLSRGERQRLALVMALIKDVRMIVCDEPTSALDINNSRELLCFLKIISRKYNIIVLIASHDKIAYEYADVVYLISDKKLLLQKKPFVQSGKYQAFCFKKECDDFYKIYKNKSKLSLVLKMVSFVLIMAICLDPVLLNDLMESQKTLYSMVVSDEIIVSNTKEVQPFGTYFSSVDNFSYDEMRLIDNIEYIADVKYYWELDGFIVENKEYVKVIPRDDITHCVVSSTSGLNDFDQFQMQAKIIVNKKEYEFNMVVKEYDVIDIPQNKYMNVEVLYIPYSLLVELLEQQNITESGSLVMHCEDMGMIEKTKKELSYWFKNATITSQGVEVYNKLMFLQSVEKFVVILKVVLVFVGFTLTSIIQLLNNKKRKPEINNLRINGLDKSMYFKMHYFENNSWFICTVAFVMVSFVLICVYTKKELMFISVLTMFMQVILSYLLMNGIPAIINGNRLFKQDVSHVLRNE